MTNNLTIQRYIFLFTFLMLNVCFTSMVCAQEHLGRSMFMLSNINTAQGLSSARVYSIMQTEDGAMWISTKRGVDRYNGQVVKNYQLATDKMFSDACGGRNFKLLKDAYGQVYAYDNKGKLYKYNKVEDTFVLTNGLFQILGGNVVVNETIIDEKGNFWIATDKGVYVIPSHGKGKFILKNLYVNHVAFVGNTLLVGSPKGVFSYSLTAHRLSGKRSNYSVLSSYHDVTSHQLWLGTFHQGIQVVDDRTWKSLPLSASLQEVPHIPVRSVISYGKQIVLMAVDGAGVYAYDKRTKHTSLLLNTDGRYGNALHGNGVYALCRDRLGDLWIGSYSGGVDLAIPMEHTLEYVRHEYLNNQSLMDNCVNDILQSTDGKIWYATDKGVSVYDELTHQWHHVLRNQVVALTLCQTSTGKILVGTYGAGVYEVRADGSATSVYSLANGTLKTDYVYSIFTDSEGGLWIGCLDGNMAYVAPNHVIRYLPISEVQCIMESPDKKYIDVGTSHGCYRVDKRGHRVSRFYYAKEYPNTDYNFFVNSMAYQDARYMWIATDGGGVCLYDLKTRHIQAFTTMQSLPSNNVYALIKTKQGKVWMSTDKGLAFIEHGKVVNVNFFQGMEDEYKRMSVARTQDGRLIFGGSNGAVILSPRFAKGLNYVAPLHIRSVEVEGIKLTESWSQKLFNMLQEGNLRFSHSENTIVFCFESINYQYQHDIQYQYFLKGFDRQWSELSSKQEVRYANLPPGSYELYVKAIGRSNGRTLGEASLSIHISQPWWNTWWAWMAYLALMATIGYFGWDYYRERLHRKYYDEKIKFFVNTAHNIRTPLSLVLAPLADLAKDSTLGETSRSFLNMAQRNGEKLLRMVTELLDFQKMDQVKKMVHLQNIELSVLLRQQVDKFMVAANEKNIKLELGICPRFSMQTDLKMMDLVFENLLSNAVKYTPELGSIVISAFVDKSKKIVKVLVSDTGIGIPVAERKHIFQSFYRASNAVKTQEMGSGLGLVFSRQLVKRLGGKLSFESEEGKGTTFILVLPLEHSMDLSQQTTSVVEISSLCQEKSFLSPSAASENVRGYTEGKELAQQDTILFVDDNADLRQYIRMAFGDVYHVVDVASGDEALAYLQNDGECDIVISDVMMPGMQGDELCHRIKENKETSWLPVILLTAKTGRNFMIEGLELGADDYIAKPFDSAILMSKVASMLKNRRRLSKYYMQQSLALVRGEQLERNSSSTFQEGAMPVDTIPHTKVEDVPQELEINSADQVFIEKATHIVLKNLSDTNFGIDSLCSEMAMSRTLFYGRLKNLTGQTPQDFVRLIRLEQATMFLKQGYSVLDVSVKTGFVNVKYFSTVFKKQFGMPPSKFQG